MLILLLAGILRGKLGNDVGLQADADAVFYLTIIANIIALIVLVAEPLKKAGGLLFFLTICLPGMEGTAEQVGSAAPEVGESVVVGGGAAVVVSSKGARMSALDALHRKRTRPKSSSAVSRQWARTTSDSSDSGEGRASAPATQV